MADMYAVSGDTLTDIANAIRSKAGSEEQLTVDAMADAIQQIPTGGSTPEIDWNNPTSFGNVDVTPGTTTILDFEGCIFLVIGYYGNYKVIAPPGTERRTISMDAYAGSTRVYCTFYLYPYGIQGSYISSSYQYRISVTGYKYKE